MRILITVLSLTIVMGLNAQLTIIVNQIPSNTPAGAEVFIAGNFQNWNPGDQAYKLQANSQGNLEITFTPSVQNMSFKFTRGSWDTVEGNANGGFLPDRSYTYNGGLVTLTVQILSWEDVGGTNSTAAANVSVMSTDFYMPQLDRYRRIWIYLPPDYDASQDHYPVMYMHDGQNVFDAATSFSGEWEVDETLNELYAAGDPGIIVVAVDNGGSLRIDEYSPWVNPTYGGGDGEAYMDFMANTLKPYIDANYRTLPGRENTALMGSSLGGLITHYAAIALQDTYSKVGIFSPSYWFAEECYSIVSDIPQTADMRIFMLAGGMESSETVPDAEAMIDTFLAEGYEESDLTLQVDADGQHSEWYWAREFGEAYQWLFAETNAIPDLSGLEIIQLYPNPTSDSVSISAVPFELKADLVLEILDLYGRRLLIGKKGEQSMGIKTLSRGNYILRVSDIKGNSKVFTVVKE